MAVAASSRQTFSFKDPAQVAVVIAVLAVFALLAGLLVQTLTAPSDGAVMWFAPRLGGTAQIVITAPQRTPDGLGQGDILRSIAGLPIEAWISTALRLEPPPIEWQIGRSVLYQVERDGQLLNIQVTPQPYRYTNPYSRWGQLVFALFYLSVGGFVFAVRPAQRAAQTMFMAAAAFAGQATTRALGLLTGNLIVSGGAWLTISMLFLVYLLFHAALLHYCLVFPARHPWLKRAPWLVVAAYLAPYAGLAFGTAAILPGAVDSIQALYFMGVVFRVIQVAAFLLSTLALVSNYHLLDDENLRLPARWVVVVIALCLACGLILNLASILYFDLHWVQGLPWDDHFAKNLGWLVACLVPLSMAAAILRRRLFDIELVFNRALVYSALTLLVMAIYLLVVEGLARLFTASARPGLSTLGVALAIVLVSPLRERLQRAVNRLMYGERDEPYALLAGLSRRLESSLVPGEALQVIVETIGRGLKLPFTAIAIEGAGGFSVLAQYSAATPSQPGIFSSFADLNAWPGAKVPLTYQGERLGWLMLSQRSRGEIFSPTDERILGDLARQAGVILHASLLHNDLQLARQRLVTAREEERRRLRRDLHDGLGPTLASLTLKLDAAHNLLGSDPQRAANLLDELAAQTQEIIAEVRRLVYNLRPPALDELGLVAALQELAERHQSKRLRIHLETPPHPPPLPAAVEVAVYRIVQEALTNVARHSQASQCTVALNMDDHMLQLEISDDGVGLPQSYRAGLGLHTMRERLAELNGEFELTGVNPHGVHIRACLPLAPETLEIKAWI